MCVSVIAALCGESVQKQDEVVRKFGRNFVEKFKVHQKKRKLLMAKESEWLDTEFECKYNKK